MQPVTLTTPEFAVSPEHDDSAPPEALRVMLVEALVTTLPAASSTFTTGWVARLVPAAAPTGCVVKTSLAAAPTAMLKGLLIAVVSVPSLAVNVYAFPARLTAQPVNVTTPAFSDWVQPERVAPLDPVEGVTASDTVELSIVTGSPFASSTSTTG